MFRKPGSMTAVFRAIADLRRSRATLLKIVNFALVGLGNTAVDFGVFTLAYEYLHWPLVACNLAAWLVAVSGSYVLNTLITFRVETGRILRRRDYLNFVASGVLGVIATTATLVICSQFLQVMVAKLISILAGFVVNFVMSHFVVFRARARGGPV